VSVFVANESDSEVDEEELVALARHVLAEMGVDPIAELSVLLVDPDAMERLHVKWMGEPGPTDVLSFPMDELGGNRDDDEDEPRPALLGDVVLCPEVAREQAESLGRTYAEELHLLCAHGILHLLGYDHAEPADEKTMVEQQNRVLASWHSSRT
jgi:probable rRNA maturation factor